MTGSRTAYEARHVAERLGQPVAEHEVQRTAAPVAHTPEAASDESGGAAEGFERPIADPASSAQRGTRMRAGNAMGRTRAAVAAGTAQCLQQRGARRTTMVDIAAAAGIAKGTLYNHVRTRSEAYRLLAEVEVGRVVALLAPGGEDARTLRHAGEAVATHPVVRSLAAAEPAALCVLCLPGEATDAPRALVLAALVDLLGVQVAPLALRWFISLLLDPGTAQDRVVQANDLAALSRRAAPSAPRPADADLASPAPTAAAVPPGAIGEAFPMLDPGLA